MTMVNDINGKAIDFEAAMALADPEICEEINNGLDMGVERAGDRWQVRAIERDTGKLIVFPYVFDDPDEASRQFASVCKSPHYRSVDIESVLD